jgi:hypothetical protein
MIVTHIVFTNSGVCLRGIGNAFNPNPNRKHVDSWSYSYRGALKPEYFHKNYIQQNKPLLIKNSFTDWPALKYWTGDDYLRENFGNEVIDYEKLKRQEKSEQLTHKKLRKTFDKFLSVYTEDAETGYQHHLDTEVFKEDPFRDDYKLPEYMPCAKDGPYFTELRLEMGHGGQRTILHNTDYETVYHVIDGTKRITMFPPSQAKYLYEENDAEDLRSSPIDVLIPAYKNHPLFKLAEQPYEVIMEPGDALFIPAFWFHEVESTCRHISIDMRFDVHNAKAMQAEIKRRGTNPDSESLWRMALGTESACNDVRKWDSEAKLVQTKRDRRKKAVHEEVALPDVQVDVESLEKKAKHREHKHKAEMMPEDHKPIHPKYKATEKSKEEENVEQKGHKHKAEEMPEDHKPVHPKHKATEKSKEEENVEQKGHKHKAEEMKEDHKPVHPKHKATEKAKKEIEVVEHKEHKHKKEEEDDLAVLEELVNTLDKAEKEIQEKKKELHEIKQSKKKNK